MVIVMVGSGKIRHAAGAIGTKHGLEVKKPAVAVLAAAFVRHIERCGCKNSGYAPLPERLL